MRWKLLAAGIAICALAAGGLPACGDDGGAPVELFEAGVDGGSGDDGGGFVDAPAFNPTDGGSTCVPKTCVDQGFTCGSNSDGCGNLIDCGPCAAPNYCGGGGFSRCGYSADGGGVCVPKTCGALGFNCGATGDGCNGVLNCGTCNSPDVCGGGGKANVCGTSVPCTNLCLKQVVCDGGGTTSISGRVVAGTLPKYGAPDPVPNVVVYVPNSAVLPFTKGVSCNQCGAEVSGSPLVKVQTAVDGTFTLPNMPVGSTIPVVIQLGRWRRQISVVVNACQSNVLGDIHMPRNKGEGDIPFTALSSGDIDTFECVLLKMGIDAAEFTNPAGGGRVEFYRGNGAEINVNTPAESTLTNTVQAMDSYDQVFFPCWGVDPTANGSPSAKTPSQLANLVSYTSAGGRAFATHFSYAWLYNNVPFNQTATWAVNSALPATATGEVDTSFQKGKTFAQWLGLVNALNISTVPPDMTITAPRHDFSGVTSPAQRWMYTVGQNPNFPLNYSFDTPWNSNTQCGRVVFSDFHVATGSGTCGSGKFAGPCAFPVECDGNPMTGQEKALEYMIWDLASCVPPPPPPQCVPTTCQAQNLSCGPAGDGCGNLLNCGTCVLPNTCGGGGVSGKCGNGGSCVPKTCQDLNINCGPTGDGCGNQLNCGACILPATCGGGGVAGQCGTTGIN